MWWTMEHARLQFPQFVDIRKPLTETTSTASKNPVAPIMTSLTPENQMPSNKTVLTIITDLKSATHNPLDIPNAYNVIDRPLLALFQRNERNSMKWVKLVLIRFKILIMFLRLFLSSLGKELYFIRVMAC